MWQIPEDFDPSVLPPVEYDDKTSVFMRNLSEAFMERWLTLRCKVSCLCCVWSKQQIS